jgi:exosortase/archaeosortase family protein
MRPVLGFVLRFAAVWVAALLLLSFVPQIERAAIANTTESLRTLASWAGVPAARVADYLHIGRVTIEIVPDCTPLMPIVSLWAAVLAFPSAPLWKAGGLLAGAAVLWFYNLARIFVLVAVLRWQPGWFEFVHVYLWQTITLVVVFALFLGWLGLQNRRRASGGAAVTPA